VVIGWSAKPRTGTEEQAEEGNGRAADKVKRAGGGVGGGEGDGGGEVR